MLRTIFVLIIVLLGGLKALQGPFEGLLFYLWIAYFRPESWMWSPALVQALNLSFNSGLYLMIRSIGVFFRPRIELRSVLLLTFGILNTLSAYYGHTDASSWTRWIEFTKTLTTSYILFVLASQDLSKFRMAVLVIAVSLGLEAAKQGYVGLILHPGGRNENGLPQLGDNNGVAVGMFMLAPLFLSLAMSAATKWERRMHLGFFLGIVYRGISTYSRGGFLSAGTLATVYVLRSKQKVRAALGAVVVAAIVLSVLPSSFWDRMSTMEVSSEDEMESSSKSRLHFWRVAVDMANDHPLLGVGHNAFNAVYNQYDYSKGFFGKGRSVHSMWFGVLAELGYPALLVFVAMILLSITGMNQVVRRARRGELPMEFYHYAVALQTAFAAGCVGGSFVPWQYTEMLYHCIALSMALRALALRTAATPVPVPVPTAAPSPREHVRTGFQPAAAAMHRGRAHV